MQKEYMDIEGLAYMIDNLFPGIYPGVDYVCQCEYEPDGVTLKGDAVIAYWGIPSAKPAQEYLVALWKTTYKSKYEQELAEWKLAEEARKQRVVEGSLIDPNYVAEGTDANS